MKLPRLLGSVRGSRLSKPTTVVSSHEDYTPGETTGGLSVLFTVLCIVDLFGVFPIVALAKSVISCGIYGIPLVLSVFGLQLYTAVLLGRSWLLAQEINPQIKEKNRFPYAAVAELAFGRYARQLVTFFIDATVFGAGVPNLIVASQSMQLFWWKITGGGVGVSYCLWMLLIGLLLCPVMWLGSPKDMKPLALTSVVIVTTVALSTWICILTDNVSPPSSGALTDYQPNAQDFLIAYGIIAFQFDIHPMLLTIQVDMKDSRKINSAVLGGFLITGTMFAVTTGLAAYRYGSRVDNNILQGIPPSIPLYMVALLVTLQLCLSSAVGNSALFQHIEDILKIPRDFCIQRCLIRSGIVAVAVMLGETVPRFDLVMGLVGSTLTGPLMFICPPLFFLKLCYLKSNAITVTENNTDRSNLIISTKYSDIKTSKELQNGYSITSQNGNSTTSRNANSATSRNGNLTASRNANSITSQNGGDATNFPLILKRAFRTTYQTFSKYDQIDVNNEIDEYTVKWHDVSLAIIVMMMGIAATIVATYSSWSDAITSSSFSPPCLMNVTAAARSFLQMSTSL